MGFSNSTITKWKKGATPDGATLAKVSRYFNVSSDYLLGLTPESLLLCTEYKLSEAEKSYEKEADELKRAELAIEIDLLKDSVEDQKLAGRISGRNEPDSTALMAAFFQGYGDGLTAEEKDNLWRDAQDFARFKADQMRREKSHGN